MVGARGFEPRTPCAQGRCATRLRYAPTSVIINEKALVARGEPAAFECSLDVHEMFREAAPKTLYCTVEGCIIFDQYAEAALRAGGVPE